MRSAGRHMLSAGGQLQASLSNPLSSPARCSLSISSYLPKHLPVDPWGVLNFITTLNVFKILKQH